MKIMKTWKKIATVIMIGVITFSVGFLLAEGLNKTTVVTNGIEISLPIKYDNQFSIVAVDLDETFLNIVLLDNKTGYTIHSSLDATDLETLVCSNESHNNNCGSEKSILNAMVREATNQTLDAYNQDGSIDYSEDDL